jgi:predicted nuclease of restriction endonuclease-like (RecB) superfamily
MRKPSAAPGVEARYELVLDDVVDLVEDARRMAARSVNTIMTATYWAIGRRIVEEQQSGRTRAEYGEELIKRLSADLVARFGRGFGRRNLALMRAFYLDHTKNLQTASAKSTKHDLPCFPLPWSHYVRLLSVRNPNAREFYEEEALRGGWTTRQLDRQIGSQFYERTALSKNKAAMLAKRPAADRVAPEEEIKDPYVLEFLGLKDEYSETELEAALIEHLQAFLMELGGEFTFVGRQRRLRVGDQWFRIDLLLFHRRLRCLVGASSSWTSSWRSSRTRTRGKCIST